MADDDEQRQALGNYLRSDCHAPNLHGWCGQRDRERHDTNPNAPYKERRGQPGSTRILVHDAS
ncbi:hypothetical protein [Streptomyces sp. MMS24-I29]|uniref:hypothetical protein n=1 Tax=Streptomyces sp. MMS24-I29 TaxID=3351480 RepID=UPI003C7E7A5B